MNHFEYHSEISTKHKLLANLTDWHNMKSELVFRDCVPLTFYIKIPSGMPQMDFAKKVVTPAIVNFSKTFSLLEKYEQTTSLSTIKAIPG